MATDLKIFVLADTHDKLPEKLELLAAGADEIWHLGDVCAPAILQTIENFGPPVTIVRGNCDSNPEWPITVNLKRNGVRFRLVHEHRRALADALGGTPDCLRLAHRRPTCLFRRGCRRGPAANG